MRRLYFLSPDLATTRRIVDELLLARVEVRHIHVLAKRNTPLEDLPEAGVLEKTDLLPALERGVALGGLTGALAGLAAIALPAGVILGGGAVLASSLAGAGVGGLLSSMVGAGIGNSQLRQFEAAIEQGEFLMMVDVPRQRVEEIEDIIRSHHPEVECGGTEPTIPPFP